MTRAEQDLFDTELSSVELCEEHLPTRRGSVTTPTAESARAVLPDWFDRPGAPEAVEVGANLRGRYAGLGVELGARRDDGAQLLQKVLGYEADYGKLKDWLNREKETIASLPPFSITSSEIRQQLKGVEVGKSCHVTCHVIFSCGLASNFLLFSLRILGEISRTKKTVWKV